ncbi:hypothetical protein GCM10017778_27960 [Streptomyces vinaceus]|nr:hypothetical protein GCM10017778_27960 [Streptomyces vinaceus]
MHSVAHLKNAALPTHTAPLAITAIPGPEILPCPTRFPLDSRYPPPNKEAGNTRSSTPGRADIREPKSHEPPPTHLHIRAVWENRFLPLTPRTRMTSAA